MMMSAWAMAAARASSVSRAESMRVAVPAWRSAASPFSSPSLISSRVSSSGVAERARVKAMARAAPACADHQDAFSRQCHTGVNQRLQRPRPVGAEADQPAVLIDDGVDGADGAIHLADLVHA